jgi:DNA-binding transcriptional ArsR family regulator
VILVVYQGRRYRVSRYGNVKRADVRGIYKPDAPRAIAATIFAALIRRGLTVQPYRVNGTTVAYDTAGLLSSLGVKEIDLATPIARRTRSASGGKPTAAQVAAKKPTVRDRLLRALASGVERTAAQLAKELRISESSARSALNALKQRGLVTTRAVSANAFAAPLWRRCPTKRGAA